MLSAATLLILRQHRVCAFKGVSLPDLAAKKSQVAAAFLTCQMPQNNRWSSALPLGFPFTSRARGLSRQPPSSSLAQVRLGFEEPALCQDDHFIELCFERLEQSFSIHTGMPKQKAKFPTSIQEEPQSRGGATEQKGWMNAIKLQKNCMDFFFFPGQATFNSRYTLLCGSCCCKAACLQLSTARNTIKSSNCLYTRTRKP